MNQKPENYKFESEYMKDCASEIIDRLIPTFQQVTVAGSIRRGNKLVKDIEIVLAPQMMKNLFGEDQADVARVLDTLADMKKNGNLDPGKGGERYRKFTWYGSGPDPRGYYPTIDLFIVHPPATWGVTLAIRTGPAEFSRQIVTQRNKGGLLPSYLNVKDGELLCNGNRIPTPTEKDFFHEIRIPWVAPTRRGKVNYRELLSEDPE